MVLRAALIEGVERSSAVHAAALMRALEVIGSKEGVDGGLKLVDVFEPGFVALDAKAFVKECTMESFKKAVALGPTNLGGFVLDIFELEEKLIGMLVGATTKFSSVVGEDCLDGNAVLFGKGRMSLLRRWIEVSGIFDV